MLVVSAVVYAVYVGVILVRADGRWLADVPYAAALLTTIGSGIVASIVAETVIGAFRPRDSRATDVRDREIGRLGDHVGQSFLVIGAVSAMLMALAEWDDFWIANAIYLGFVLSAVVGSLAKVVVYRRSLPQW
jgi:branched-subunit amino acid ABC-type transport system permease component